MIHGYVPTNKEKLDWRLEIKTKKEYDLAVGSGIGWVLFPTLPISWTQAEKELKEMEEGNDTDNSKSDCSQ